MRHSNALECGGDCGTAMALPQPSAAPRPVSAQAGWRALLGACGPYEWVTLAYLGITNLLLAVFHRNLPGVGKYVLLHCGIAGAILVLLAAAGRWPNAAWRFARHWYPFALFIFFFEELHYLVHLIFPAWFDRWLIEFDFALLGVHPTVWLEKFSAPALNDLMAFFYLTYYLYTVVLAAVLYVRKELRNFWTVITSTAVAYVIGYVIALVLPVEGPFHTLRALQSGGLEGGPVTALMNLIQRFGRVHGAAFPSLHVAGAFVALLCAWRSARRFFWIFLPFFAAMCVSTVYGRYHYVADVFGGLLAGAVGIALGRILEAKRHPEVEE